MFAQWLNFIWETFPPAPTLTEKNLPDQSGRVFIITGATSGVGEELAKILYGKNARVWLAARSDSKLETSIKTIQAANPESTGRLATLKLDFEDLSSIKPAAEQFLANETRLDVLFNNAGVLLPPVGSTTKQGHELQFGVNTLGPFLFTQLVTPLLVRTAKVEEPGTVRVVWVSSSAAYLFSPAGGVDMQELKSGPLTGKPQGYYYSLSKGGNVLHAIEYAKLHKDDGILSTSCNPGNLRTGLQVNFSSFAKFFAWLISYPPIFGAYTELFAGLSDQVTMEQSGSWIIPWGILSRIRTDIEQSAQERGGEVSLASEFWKWSEEQTKAFA